MPSDREPERRERIARGARSRRLGRAAERCAERYLRAQGWTVLDRNWRSGHRELDLVAREGDVVVFVEVKARGAGPQAPEEALGPRQRRDLRRAAEAWVHAHPGVGREFRFDLIAIRGRAEGRLSVSHVRQAFFGDDA